MPVEGQLAENFGSVEFRALRQEVPGLLRKAARKPSARDTGQKRHSAQKIVETSRLSPIFPIFVPDFLSPIFDAFIQSAMDCRAVRRKDQPQDPGTQHRSLGHPLLAAEAGARRG